MGKAYLMGSYLILSFGQRVKSLTFTLILRTKMVISHYVNSIREGIKLAGVDTSFLLVSEGYLYGDFGYGRRVFQDVYRKPIPPTFNGNDLIINHKLSNKERELLNLPSKFNPIVVLTKSRTVKHFQQLLVEGFLKSGYIEYIRQLSPKEFGKVLTIYSFHEASHKKYTLQDVYDILWEFDLYDYYRELTKDFRFPNDVLGEFPVAIDELRLTGTRPDLKPHIIAMLDGSSGIKHVLAQMLAKRYLLEKESHRTR